MTVKDGGPAFPGKIKVIKKIPDGFEQSVQMYRDVEYLEHVQGMTLRDWYAGMALQGLVGRDVRISEFGFVKQTIDLYVELSKRSYALADAMISEREKK